MRSTTGKEREREREREREELEEKKKRSLTSKKNLLFQKKTHSLNALVVSLLLATDGSLCDLCSLLGRSLGHLKFKKTFEFN